ncbi:MAG: pitrilysin family protein [Acidobacteriota bacterium]
MKVGIARSQPPMPGPIRPYRFPDFLRTRLDNGLEVVVATMKAVPLARHELILPAGNQYESADAAGLAALTGAMLKEGTAERSGLDIATAAESLGGSLATGVDRDVGYAASGVLSRHYEASVELIASSVLGARFPGRDLERVRRQHLTDLVRQRDSPRLRARQELMRLLYPGTPYAHPVIGIEEVLQSISRDQVVDFARRHVVPNGSFLIAVGDIEPGAFLDVANRAFGHWQSREAPVRPTIDPVSSDGPRYVVIDRPGAPQTQLIVGHVGVPRNTPAYPARTVLNTILGGRFTSRLNVELRHRLGLTYSVNSRFVAQQGPGPFEVRAAIDNEGVRRAVEAVHRQLHLLRDEGVEAKEVQESRQYLAGVFPYATQTMADIARRLEILSVHGLEDDYWDTYVDRLLAVETEDVQRAARAYLRPDELIAVAVGPAAVLEPQLSVLGEVEVIAS